MWACPNIALKLCYDYTMFSIFWSQHVLSCSAKVIIENAGPNNLMGYKRLEAVHFLHSKSCCWFLMKLKLKFLAQLDVYVDVCGQLFEVAAPTVFLCFSPNFAHMICMPILKKNWKRFSKFELVRPVDLVSSTVAAADISL